MATTPFGEPHATSALTSYMFTGKDLDDTGLYYFAARYYDASVGRFTSQDPHWNHHNMIYGDDPNNKFPLIAAITQSTNLYVYCANNPLIYVDPDGEVIWITAGIGALIGGAAGLYYGYQQNGNWSLDTWKYAGIGAVGGAAVGVGLHVVGVKILATLAPAVAPAAKGAQSFIPEHIDSGGKLIGWAKGVIEDPRRALSLPEVQQLLAKANELGVKVSAGLTDLRGLHNAEGWKGVMHFHLGDKRVHITFAKEAFDFLMRHFNLK